MNETYSSLCAPVVVESVLHESYDLLPFLLWIQSPFFCFTLHLPGGKTTPPRAKAVASDSGLEHTSGEYPSWPCNHWHETTCMQMTLMHTETYLNYTQKDNELLHGVATWLAILHLWVYMGCHVCAIHNLAIMHTASIVRA